MRDQHALFDPYTREFNVNPYPIYASMRQESPVQWGVAAAPFLPGCWYFTQYRDIVAALKDNRFGREIRRATPGATLPSLPEEAKAFARMSGQWMVFRDPPDHTRLRLLVNKAFTPGTVEKMRPRIEAIAQELIDRVHPTGQMDLIQDYAFLLPATVIAEILGVPAEYRGKFRIWSNAIANAIDVRQTTEVTVTASQVTHEITDFLKTLIDSHRQVPQPDLISALLEAEQNGDRLNEREIIATCILLIVAGHETTMNLIGNGMAALLANPEQLEPLRHDRSRVTPAIEELLRYDSPVQMTFRYAMEDVEYHGQVIRQGEMAGFILGAANRDPEQFPDPDRLDLTRANNHHDAFGVGIHYCVGAPLARLEGQIAITTLLDRLPGLRFSGDRLDWREMIAFRGLRAFPVAF
jgi:pimeloyl-[acyl-carrier protein] synthase